MLRHTCWVEFRMFMQAELLNLTVAGYPFPGTKKSRPSQGGILGWLLGLDRQTRSPERPAVRHALERLTFSNGTIYETNGEPLSREYLALSPVGIVSKLSLRELDVEGCEYRFELNTATDPVWRWFLQKLLPGLQVQFESKVMALTCLPADLEGNYQRIKRSMAQANLWYAEEREQLIPFVIARDVERQTAKEMEQNRRWGIRKQFDCLQI